MNISDIKEQWQPGYRNAKAGIELWNGKAQYFSEKELPTAETSLAMRIIQREQMIFPGCTALDVGCGGGRFSFAMEKLGAQVSATDFSPEMIRLAGESGAEKGYKASFSVDDWHTADLVEKGWQKGFDVVLANMTPAIASGETFLKLIKASRGWVLMVKPVRRKSPVLDELNRLCKTERKQDTGDEAMAYAFDLAWLTGGKPRLEYETQVWDMEQPLQSAIQEYTSRIASTNRLMPGDEKIIADYLLDIAQDGTVREKCVTDIAAMYWRTDD